MGTLFRLTAFKPGAHMATFYITNSPDVDWNTTNWDELTRFKYRYESSSGAPLAQHEFDRRREAGLPTEVDPRSWTGGGPRLESAEVGEVSFWGLLKSRFSGG